MDPFTFLTVPYPSSNSPRTQSGVPRKRKRSSQVSTSHVSQSDEDGDDEAAEYTAVVTPAERSQRRLAGLPLNKDPPSFPFPHTAPRTKEKQVSDKTAKSKQIKRQPRRILPESRTTHSQYLASSTTVLHRCLMARDYVGAGRALGLLLRADFGRQIDIRSEGLWGIGAEILLRQGSASDTAHATDEAERGSISREGFERARLYYERLIVDYPTHKTWPDAINALDFGTAMFGLWIYVVNHESLQLQRTASQPTIEEEEEPPEDPDHTLLEAKRWELRQARQIAEAMDARMHTAPFDSDFEIIRLRAMVALWTADLIDTCAGLEKEDQSQSDSLEQDDGISYRIERMAIDQNRRHHQRFSVDEAVNQRNLASHFFGKIKGPGESDEDSEDF